MSSSDGSLMVEDKHTDESYLKTLINNQIFIKIKRFTSTKIVVRAAMITNEIRS